MTLEIRALKDHSDNRGFSYEIPGNICTDIGQFEHAHVAAILPGHVRGNHFHLERTETLVVTWEDTWELGWCEQDSDIVQQRAFKERGAVALRIPPGVAHALANSGTRPLYLLALSDTPYSVERPDTVRRMVFPLDNG